MILNETFKKEKNGRFKFAVVMPMFSLLFSGKISSMQNQDLELVGCIVDSISQKAGNKKLICAIPGIEYRGHLFIISDEAICNTILHIINEMCIDYESLRRSFLDCYIKVDESGNITEFHVISNLYKPLEKNIKDLLKGLNPHPFEFFYYVDEDRYASIARVQIRFLDTGIFMGYDAYDLCDCWWSY